MTAKQPALKHNRSLVKHVGLNWQLYAMFLPAAVLLIIFNYYPMYGITLAFKDYSSKLGIIGSPYVGMKHFDKLFGDPDFLRVLGNTLRISTLKLVCGFPVPIILSILLNEVRTSWFKRTVQTISYLPYFISWVVVYGILVDICSIDGGAINNVIQFFTGTTVNFFGNAASFQALLILSDIWKGAGWATIIYFAAISNISPDLYEAAKIDGANRYHQIRYITLPSMVPAISITLILALGGLMNAGFDQVFNLYNPVVMDSADIIDTYVYRMGITKGKYGIATALGLFNSLVSLVLIVSSNIAIKKSGGTAIW